MLRFVAKVLLLIRNNDSSFTWIVLWNLVLITSKMANVSVFCVFLKLFKRNAISIMQTDTSRYISGKFS